VVDALWNAYQKDVTRARSLPANALKDYITEESAALSAVNAMPPSWRCARLGDRTQERRQLADELKGLVGEDQDNLRSMRSG